MQFLEGRFITEGNVNPVSRAIKKKCTLDAATFAVVLRYYWVYFTYFCHEIHIIQFAVVQQRLAITGSHPGMMLLCHNSAKTSGQSPQPASSNGNSELAPPTCSSQNQPSKLPKRVCWKDIELFILQNQDEACDVPCMVINFHNLKHQPEGAGGYNGGSTHTSTRTKFFMHGDYQLAYCSITRIITLAFCDTVFKNDCLTPELSWCLKVPKCCESLPIYWKEDMLGVPVLGDLTYNLILDVMRCLDRDAGLEDPLNSYTYQHWTANKANCNFTDQEQNQILGHARSWVFKKHYQKEFIGYDMQHFVLLCLHQEGLLKQAASMLRNQNLCALSGLIKKQLQAIYRDFCILRLQQEKKELFKEMKLQLRTLQNAKKLCPELHQRHHEMEKELTRLRKTLRTAPVHKVNRQINQMLGIGPEKDAMEVDEDWELPIPKYTFPKRAQLVE
ncbi:hypothetical protein CISG_02623 [Coccidioides immitis RMSCC 3703]|uniref:Uncharacterized protein n=2 Tax=Coccidioides immitis TaxID=5501 RepID=A0A0J8R8M4_COCIT|nr:hypothetical protein CIRG_09096 [Coccidioides immitis RMSCC 2394]KMU81246.1 hypothetical protein CISG_02623 [Coccidioides immitis RMSCC 3703]